MRTSQPTSLVRCAAVLAVLLAASTASLLAHGGHEQRAANARLEADADYRRLRAILDERPTDLASACKLATLCVEKGSAERAREILGPWWKLERQVPQKLLLIRATILQRDHDFAPALEQLSLLLRENPRHAEAWLMKSTIHAVRGDYDQAYAASLPLFAIASPIVASTAAANALSLSGKAEESYALLAAKLVHRRPGEDREILCWAWTTLAEIAVRLGKEGAAQEHFEAALAAAPTDQYTRARYGEFLVDHGNTRDAWRLLRPAVQGEAEKLVLALVEKASAHPRPQFCQESTLR